MRHLALGALFLLVAELGSGLFFARPALAQSAPPSSGWVVLPVSEYRALRDKAYPPQPPPDPPPVDAAIARVEYDLTVQGESAVGEARLTVDVFKDGWVSVPIPAGLRVRDAKIDGRPITLVDDREGRSSVLLSRAGRSIIALDLAVPIRAASGVESIALPPSSSPVQRVLLALKSADLAVTVTGGFIAERSAAGQSARLLVCGRANERLGLSWSRRRDNPSATQPLRLRGAITELVGLGEDAAQVSAQVSVDVVQGQAERATLKLPPGFVVGQVSGPLVGDWEVRGTDLLLTFLEPVDRSVGLTVTGESRIARDGRIAVPLIRLANAERETGGVAVEVLGAGEIKGSSTRALDAADAADLGPMVAARQSPALVAFRSRPQAWDAPRALDVTVARYTAQAVLLANIEEARYTALLAEDGKTLVEAAYAVRNSQRSFVAVTLPATATLWSASIDGRPVRPGRTAEGALLLPILKERLDSNVASVVRVFFLDRGNRWADNATVTVHLPVVDLPISRTGLHLFHSPRFRMTLEPGVFRVEPFTAPQSAALNRVVSGGVAGGIAAPLVAPSGIRAEAAAPPILAPEEKERRATEQERTALLTEYQRAAGTAGVVGLLPIEVIVPSLGPSLFVAAELTPEGKAAEARFTIKREVK